MSWKHIAIGIGLWLVAIAILSYSVFWIFGNLYSPDGPGCFDIVIQGEELSRVEAENLLRTGRVREVAFNSEAQNRFPVTVFTEKERQSCTEIWYTYESIEGFRSLLQECGDICRDIMISED
ncbi:MAG: hypothetical protein HYT49_03795 [Candidatus Wildermuthbacteria bacterium]|nr:hypothetical protein [Candidatus Wildermuthbacteria bacterium]